MFPLFFVQPMARLAFWAAGASGQIMSSFSSTNAPSRSPRDCSQPVLCPSVCAWNCSGPDAGPCPWPRWTPQGSHSPSSPACPGPLGCNPFPPECQLHHPAQCHPWNCWGCTQSHCPCHQKPAKQKWLSLNTSLSYPWHLI